MLKDIRSLIVNTSRMEVLDIHGRKLILYVTHLFDFFSPFALVLHAVMTHFEFLGKGFQISI